MQNIRAQDNRKKAHSHQEQDHLEKTKMEKK